MVKKLFLMAAAALIAAPSFAQATKEEKLKEKGDLAKLNEGWTRKFGLGLGMNQIGVINPRVGGANDQLGFNGILTGTVTYRMGRMAWDNVGAMQYGILRNGVLGTPLNEVPYVKSMDNLTLNSKFGYGIAEGSAWFYSVGAGFRSQMTPTYQGNYLSPTLPNETPIADFLAPATLYVAPGIDYKPTDNFSVLFSPATLRMIIVGNNNIAKLGTMGNPIKKDATGKVIEDYRNVDTQLGASLTANYKTDFWDKKIQFQTGLNLFSNYLTGPFSGDVAKPQNIDVDWSTATKVNIFKGFGIGLNTNLYYDDDVDVVRVNSKATDASIRGGKVLAPAGYDLGKGIQFIEGFFITYDRTF